MRGKHSYPMRTRFTGGNIPAHAGKTAVRELDIECEKEHPRACGENFTIPNHFDCVPGTSPRMRGKLTCFINLKRNGRNIPAHAGKTITVVTPDDEYKEHPRACGENASQPGNFDSMAGTSPRMRGKRLVGHLPRRRIRNIPAHAGKTSLC